MDPAAFQAPQTGRLVPILQAHRAFVPAPLYRSAIQTARASALLGKVVDELFERVVINLPVLREKLDISYNSAKNLVDRLVQLEILTQATVERPKTWIATEILQALSTEMPPG